MIIQHHMAAMTATRMNIENTKKKMKSMERLSSGYRINRAADDAAALSISEKMRAQIRGLQRAEQNVQDGISYVQVADGALSNAHDILHRMRELAIQSANDVNTEQDRTYIDEEVQILKDELDRIFEETEFNNKMVWDTNGEGRVQIGSEKKQAATMHTSSTNTYLTNTNKGAVPYGGYSIEVKGTDPDDPDNYGFVVKWTGYNKKEYSTKLISFDNIDFGTKSSFGFNIKDHIDKTKYPETEGLGYQIGWSIEESTTVEDLKKSIDGVYFSNTINSNERVEANSTVPGVSYAISTNYLAELGSGRDVENYDTTWIEPKLSSGTNVISTPSYTDVTEESKWTLGFKMPNIGDVTAVSDSVSFTANDTDDADMGHWWYWVKNSRGENSYKQAYTYTPGVGSSGSLKEMTDAITNSTGAMGRNNTKGISLIDDTDSGGVIKLGFLLKADDATANYEGRPISTVGSMTISVNVYKNHPIYGTDTEETLMARIQSALNSSSVIDAYHGYSGNSSPQNSSMTTHSSSARYNLIDVPIYKATVERVIQAGANSGQLITMTYDSLRTINLGIGDTNVLTGEESAKAITAVDVATDMISAQRSLFGAYQNRFEYAAKVNANTAENTQDSESVLRDLDMAEEAMNLAKITILEQASQSMIANANQQPQNILKLISQ